MTGYETYQKAKAARQQAEKWQAMPTTKGRHGDSFGMSAAHGSIKFMRCGQYSIGGTNYWDSPTELNAAILYVIASDPSVILKAIELMKERERKLLVACREETEVLMASIEDAEGEKGGE